LRFA
jgi:hypothetical protein